VLNLTCPSNPVLSRVRYSHRPAMLTVVSTGSSRTCPLCDVGLPITPPSPPPTSTTTRADGIPKPTQEPSVLTGGRGSNLASQDVVSATTSSSVVLVLAVVVVTAIVLAVTMSV
jgi:hypothetical protein